MRRCSVCAAPLSARAGNACSPGRLPGFPGLSRDRTERQGRRVRRRGRCHARGAAVLRGAAPGGRERWERTNFAGRTVALYPRPAAVAGAALGGARVRPAVGGAVLVAGICGAYDDVVGAGDPRRGFRAHLGALREGEVTGGAVKLAGISAAGLVAGALLKERPLDKVLAGVVIAGAAHFVNLVDVRPGRAAGVVLALGAPGLLRAGAAGSCPPWRRGSPGPSCRTISVGAGCSGTPGRMRWARCSALRSWWATGGRGWSRMPPPWSPRRCAGRG